MGYISHKVDNNPLWGYKQEIKEDIKNGNDNRKFGFSSKGWKEEKKKAQERDLSHVQLVSYGDRFNKPETSTKYKRLPEKVREKCREWLDNNRDSIEYQDREDFIKFRYFFLEVDISNRGNPKDIRIMACFKDH